MPDTINRLPKITPNVGDDAFSTHYSQLIDTVNSLAGHNGSIPLASSISMKGNRIMNIGTPVDAADAVSSGVAESKYSASAIAPQLEGSGKNSLKSMRRVNDTNQREQSSSYMNDLMSSVPNSNAIYPTVTNSGSQVQVVIPATKFAFADGTSIYLMSRTDLLSMPSQFAISAISSSGTVVTVTTTTASGLVAGGAVTIAGVTPTSFNGTYTLTSASGTTLTYQSSLGTLSGSGGFAQAGSVFYYLASKRSTMVKLIGPFSSDTLSNRLNSNLDGDQIVAVVTVTASGGQVAQSGGGGSAIVGSPTAGSFF